MTLFRKIGKLLKGTILFFYLEKIHYCFTHYLRYPQKVFTYRYAAFEILFSTQDEISKKWFLPRFINGYVHEHSVTLHMMNTLMNCRTFIDAGAYVGYYTILSKFVNSNLKVFAFELDPGLTKVINKNVSLNKLTDVFTYNMALGSEAKPVFGVSIPPFNSLRYITSNKPRIRFYHARKVIPLKTESLDYLVADTKIDVIKIDVEGAEVQVLHGMKNILRRDKPIIYLEVHAKAIGNFANTLLDIEHILLFNGYKIYRFPNFRNQNADAELVEITNLNVLDSNEMILCK